MGAYIPEAMKSADKWILHDEKKRPFSAKAGNNSMIDATNAREWTDYIEAVQKLKYSDFDGLGFVLSNDDNIICIDLDSCIDETGNISQFALTIVESFSDTYIEISRSGRGLHIFCFGDIPQSFRHENIEVYKDKRYIAITGEPYEAFNELQDKSAEVMGLYSIYANKNASKGFLEPNICAPATQEDREVIRKAQNGANGGQFKELWAGSWRDKYKTQSNADMRLISILWYYSRNAEQVARLFLASGLGKREKAQRADYIQRTIEAAARNTSAPYQQKQGKAKFKKTVTDQNQQKKYKRF